MAVLQTVLIILALSEIGLISLKTNGQYITTDPVSSIDFEPSDNILGELFCLFNTQNDDDVIGWVVGSTRISNGVILDTAAVTSALGASAVGKLSILHESNEYALDFFSADTDVVGDYKCQLCTNDGNDGCGTVIEESTACAVRTTYQPTESPTCLPPSTTSSRVVLEDSIMLSCSSDPGVPEVQLEWRYASNNQAIPGQSEPVQVDGLLYNNFTFTPTLSDAGTGPICRVTTNTGAILECAASPITLVSTPTVTVRGPSSTPAGASATFTCSAESTTNTLISTYTWDVDVEASRIATDESIVTISDVTEADHQKSVSCTVTDAAGMTGSGAYPILVMGEVIPSNLPTFPTLPPVTSTEPLTTSLALPPGGLSTGVIVAIVIVVIILLCIILGSVWLCCSKNRMQSKKQAMYPRPTVEKNNLSPKSTSPLNAEKTFTYPNVDPRNPDVVPKGMNEREVDGNVQQYWRESAASVENSPNIKSVNMPFSSKSSLHNQNTYNPAYDDKADLADLDYKPPLDDKDYSDSGIGYRDGENGYYSDEKYVGYDGHNYGSREFGDGHPGPYSQDYGDAGNYGTVYDDDYQQGQGQYDDYPDRMPDGSEGYNPAPDEYNDPSRDGYNNAVDYGTPLNYEAPLDYGDQPANYHPDGYSYEGQPGEYDNRPADYVGSPQDYDDRPVDYGYQPSDYPAGPDNYGSDAQDQYHPDAAYDDQYNQAAGEPYYADRIPDGGAPEQDAYNYGSPQEGGPYDDGYGNNYNDGSDYGSPYTAQDSYAPSYEDPRSLSRHSSRGEPYFDPNDEVSATSNPSYV